MSLRGYYHLPSASWKARKAQLCYTAQRRDHGVGVWGRCCKFLSESETPRTRSAKVQGRETIGVSAQAQNELALLLPLVLVRLSADWLMRACTGVGTSFLSLLLQRLISPEDTSQTHSETMFTSYLGLF